MAHKTLVGGTAYEITGGKTLVNGTAYSIKSGKTLVGGTAYEVGFVKMAKLTLDSSDFNPYYPYSYVIIDGTKYNSGAVIEVPVGTVVDCHISTEDYYTFGLVTVNGEKVYISHSGQYSYTVMGDATIYMAYDESSSGYLYGYIEITEE